MSAVETSILYQINPESGVATVFHNIVGMPTGASVRTMAIDSNDDLYILTFSGTSGTREIYRVSLQEASNAATQVATVVGSFQGCAFDDQDTFYCVEAGSNVHQVDLTTDSTTVAISLRHDTDEALVFDSCRNGLWLSDEGLAYYNFDRPGDPVQFVTRYEDGIWITALFLV